VILLAAVVASAPNRAVAGITSEWDFRNGDLAASYGELSMSYWGSTTSGAVSFADATIGDQTKKVMQYDAFTPAQGLFVDSTSLSNYTMIWDLYIPSATTKPYGTLLQTDASNVNDGSFPYKNLGSTFGIGFWGQYLGSGTFDAWHRLALTVTSNDGDGSVVSTYIDGVAGHSGSACVTNQFHVGDSGFLLFADNDGETSAGKMSAFYLTDHVMSASQIAALGGASASGIVVPEPGTITMSLLGVFGIAAYAWRKRK
jgi:hypothetical protein